MSKNQANHVGDNYAQPHLVLTNDDLLTEILIRLPILYSRIQSRKGIVENSFTLSSIEAVENVKIMQSCNGLLLCTRPGAIYWNGALHWLETKDIRDGYLKDYKLNIEDHDHPILTTIQIHQGLHQSCGCLLAVLRDYIGSREFTIYEMRKRCSVWSVREEDSCLVINLSRKVVEYNLISKTLHEIYDIGSNQLDDDELIPPFAADHNVYEFIPSFASV
ncbi:hypothetical protein Tco_0303157 [Tanacetum coccineum]